jgi:hypothetical protein
MGGAYNTRVKVDKCIQVVIGKREWKTPLSKPRSRRYDNIKMDIKNRV